ncbi:MAG: hypothetical protein GX267_11560 [Fibrobacter sp.]|jgi:hypothetical protein|nr:hypothetical protein [Fibrobacter sp.]
MGFWENITGFTHDGLPAEKMPENVKLVHSIKNQLKQLINMPKGSDLKNPDMGIEDIPDIVITVPEWTLEFGKSLSSMIKKFNRNIKEIYFNHWSIDENQCCLTCRMIVVTGNEEIIRYRAVFSALGSRQVEIISGDDDEE